MGDLDLNLRSDSKTNYIFGLGGEWVKEFWSESRVLTKRAWGRFFDFLEKNLENLIYAI